MVVYMLRKGKSWYKRAGTYCGHWVDQKYASVWTSKHGPNAAKGQWLRRFPTEEIEIVPFTLEEIKCP